MDQTLDLHTIMSYVRFPRAGDVARFDSDGFLYIVDRKKELIKYKGEQVRLFVSFLCTALLNSYSVLYSHFQWTVTVSTITLPVQCC